MELIIRKTNRSEFRQTEHLTREAFWNLYQPGSTEHFVLHNFRKSKAWIEPLDRVALYGDKIVGHIISTKAQVIASDNTTHEVLHVGPFAVDPLFQNRGIGTKLFYDSIEKAKDLVFKGMILFGNPDYYPRFGFKNAKEYGITTKEGANFDPFMAMELQDNGLSNVHGKFYLDESAEICEEELLKFEEQFPYKEKGEPKIKIPV